MSRPRKRTLPEHDDVQAWREMGALIVRCFPSEGVAPEELLPRASNIMNETRAVNVLAWLENGGYVRYDGSARRWQLTSSGRRLASEAA